MADEKTIFLVRHGKSSWDFENVSDMDRPLKNRGIRNAYDMSSLLIEREVQPELIISSPAIRALHTAIIFAKELKCPNRNLKVEDVIYFSEEHTILDFIKKTTDAVSSIMIFGHNPVISNLANMFLKQQVDYMSTCAVAELVFNSNSWLRISKDNLMREWYKTPEKS